ncbi:ABC transporter permease [Lacticaseibacillus paracasei]|uniref:ABC transporter permease n=1 Tax=Lacticaseibacillus paracasei TaxID=1597 RepID=UPI0038653876
MRITELIRISFRALTANKRRSLLTMLGIVIGITSVVTIMALGNGIKAATLKNLQTDQSGQQTAEITFLPESSTASTAGFKEDDVDLAYQTAPDKIKKVTIKHEKKRLQLNGQLANQDTMLSATLVTSMPKVQLAAGNKLTTDSLQTDGHDVLLSKKLAKKVFHGNAAALTSSVFIGKRSYNIVGIFNTPKESYSALDVDVLIPEKAYTAGQLNPGGQKLAITFQRGSDISQLANAIVRQLKKSGTERRNGSYQYFDYGELLKGIGNVISGLTLFVGAIAGISLLIAGVGVMNMMYISASERSQEIGIRMAVGATPAEIMKQFLLESVMLTLTGGVVGLVLGGLIAWMITAFLPFKPVITLGSIIGTFAISSIVGIVFGILPAKSAANKNLIDILKS